VLREKREYVPKVSSYKGRYLRETEHPRAEYREYEVRVIDEPYPERCQNNGKLLNQT
jgi:hypothetical protein